MRSPSMNDSKRTVLDTVVNIVLLVAVLYFALLPSGPIRQHLANWQQQREEARLVEQLWSALSSSTNLIGGDSTNIVLVEFGDFECPYCRRLRADLEEFATMHPTMGIAYRHLPLRRIHPTAESAALAAICAGSQGRFKAMHDYLYSQEEWLEAADWVRAANVVGVTDVEEFESCLDSEQARAQIAEDEALAELLGLSGTPSFAFRFGVHRGVVTREELARMVGAN